MVLESVYMDFIKAFFAVFVAMDAIGNLPIFSTIMQKLSVKKRNKNVDMAVSIAALILLTFLFFGVDILKYFGISLKSFQVAGGIVLLIIGLKIVLGFSLREERAKKYEIAAVPLATPLIAGPAVITVIILLVNEFGYLLALAASLLNLLLAWIVLHQTEILFKLFGRQGSDVIAKIMGLILTALAVELIKQGWASL
ncbi:MarC family protein [Candidatus Woesearchaeota archaeon]|nr:MarC family protein [Candidatus Woesearchaeota archaeon]